jgi:methionyl-tRNA formyltransferase
MQMDAGLDTGPVIAQRSIPIDASDDFGTLHAGLAELGARMMAEVIEALERGSATRTPQPAHGATYARKIDRPAPGAATRLSGEPVKIWAGTVSETESFPLPVRPGQILEAGPKGILVACGQGSLLVTELQRAGGRRLTVAEFLRGRPIAPGTFAGSALTGQASDR